MGLADGYNGFLHDMLKKSLLTLLYLIEFVHIDQCETRKVHFGVTLIAHIYPFGIVSA